ncbi:MAG: glycosyltransferase family 39 protein, partial [Epsilonproteobacteria bacterium]|nr:glycosyltransferase family 39 protein [Campylobacterota bacterium]
MKKLIQNMGLISTATLFAFFLFAIINSAWLGDDCLISLSQIVNFHHGDGLVFNYNERVQAFTHPTWFFLLSLLTFITGDYYYTIVMVSILASLLAISIIFYYTYQHNNNYASIVILGSLLFSKAFIDYTTSGLENPLSYVLFAGIIYLIVLEKEHSDKVLIFIYVLMSLLFLNRMDYALVLMPIVVVLLLRYKKRNLTPFIISALIVISWFLFSLFYFGHMFPNTYYAKLQAGYPASDFWLRGGLYFRVQYENDPITLVIIAIGIIVGFMQKGILRAISFGLILYLLYFLKSGGDFMQGRVLAVPAFVASFSISIFIFKVQYTK